MSLTSSLVLVVDSGRIKDTPIKPLLPTLSKLLETLVNTFFPFSVVSIITDSSFFNLLASCLKSLVSKSSGSTISGLIDTVYLYLSVDAVYSTNVYCIFFFCPFLLLFFILWIFIVAEPAKGCCGKQALGPDGQPVKEKQILKGISGSALPG